MKSLLDFLNRGVDWDGVIPARPGHKEKELLAVDMMKERAVRVVLHHMAARLSASRPGAGLKLSRESLGNANYSAATVSDALAKLARSGLIRRVREGRKGSTHEEIARTLFNPILIELARQWQMKHQANLSAGLRGVAADPAYVEVKTPLIWTDPSADPISMRVSEGQLPENGIGSFQKLETATYTHCARAPASSFGICIGLGA